MSIEPTDAERLEQARRLLRDGQAAGAAACLDALLAAAPENAEAHAMRGVALGMMGETAAGTRALETAIQLAPPQPIYYFNLGQIREQGGDPAGAVAAYRQALQIDPEYARAAEALQRLRGEPAPAAPAAPRLTAPRSDTTPVDAPWLIGAAPEPILSNPRARGHASGTAPHRGCAADREVDPLAVLADRLPLFDGNPRALYPR